MNVILFMICKNINSLIILKNKSKKKNFFLNHGIQKLNFNFTFLHFYLFLMYHSKKLLCSNSKSLSLV